MASTVYSSSYISSAIGLNTSPEVSVSGGSGAQELIDSVIAALYLSTSAYSVTYSVTVQVNFSGGSVSKTQNVTFNSGNASGASFSFTMPSMTAAQCNSISSITISCSDSRIFVKHTQYVTVNYTVTTACTAPTSISLSNSTPAPSANVTLSGSGAAAGSNNAITGYAIYRATSETGTYSYLKTVSTSSTSFSTTVTASATPGVQYWYKAITLGTHSGYDSSLSTAHAGMTTTASTCGAPTSAQLSATLAESDPTLTCSGATSGAGNSITGYEIQYAESADNSAWGAWMALKTVTTTSTGFSTTVALPDTRGYYRKYRIRTQGSLGETYYSDWVETSSVRKNSMPAAPSSATATPTPYESGGITVSWPSAADADNDVTAYELQRAASADGSSWGSWSDVDTGIVALTYSDAPTIARGEYVKYHVRARDSFGLQSDYTETASVRRNRLPGNPTVSLPGTGKSTYNPRQRLLITLGTEPDGQLMTLIASGYTVSGDAPFTAGRKLVLRKTANASTGTVSASMIAADTQGAQSETVERSVTYVALSWIDSDLTAGSTRIRATHINELRTKINTMRGYYGLTAYSWAETITAGSTSLRGWAEHIAEIQAAIDEVIALVNGWDTEAVRNTIVAPVWEQAESSTPKASALEQLRSMIAQL